MESTEVSHQIEILFKQLENSFQSIPSTTEDYNHGLIKKIHRLQSRFQGRLLNFSSLCQTIHHQNDQLLLESNKINISGKIIQIHPATQESISLQENHSTFNPPSQGDLEASTLDLKQQQALSPPPTKEAGDDLFHEALVRDREVAIQDLHEAVIDIHDLFMDLSTLVDEQHYLVDHIEGNMENVGMYTEDTLAQLIAGHRRRRKYSWRKNICYMILGVVLVLFVLSIVMSII